MEISCAFPTALDSPDHIVLAEELGYDRAWLYDTPQQSTDVWVTLALAAERTERIGLGPGVLVPSLRHPMVNAAATANLAALAPGRVAVAFGTGFTGRRAMGYRAIKWAFMDALHPRLPRPAARRDDRVGGRADADAAPARPRRRAARSTSRSSSPRSGPKGAAVARELGDGLYITLALPEFATEFDVGLLPVLGHDPRRRRGPGLRSRARGGRPGLGARLPRRLRVRARRSRTCRAARSGRR